MFVSHDLSLDNMGWSSPFSFFQNLSKHNKRDVERANSSLPRKAGNGPALSPVPLGAALVRGSVWDPQSLRDILGLIQ